MAGNEKKELKCRNCNSKTHFILDFGPMPFANNFTADPSINGYAYQLRVHICTSCWLFQIQEQPPAAKMFNNNYPFFTGLSKFMKKHFEEMVVDAVNEIGLSTEELNVLEIGCNDGTLLSSLKMRGIRHLGVDASSNVVERARQIGCRAEIAFFSTRYASEMLSREGKFNLIFAANVVCHIDTVLDFFTGIKVVLDSRGKFIFEEPYLLDVLQKVSYDQIYDEHVFLFSVTSIRNIISKLGLEIIKVSHQNTHGGSMRYEIAHKGSYKVDSSVAELLKMEDIGKLQNLETYSEFAHACQTKKNELVTLLNSLKNLKKRVYGYAATSKSTTILNYCGLNNEFIIAIGDSTIEKQNKVTPGTGIPVISIEELRGQNPDYIILFAWNHFEEITAKEQNSSLKKAKWISLVPKIEIVEI